MQPLTRGGSRIGYGAAAALLDVGAKVTIISSSQKNVDAAVERLASPDVKGVVADVRDESGFIKTLQSLAPIDHLVFSAVDNIIRGKLEDLDLDSAKHLFGVKFWGAVISGKGTLARRPWPGETLKQTNPLPLSAFKIRHRT